jgi:hypothetical protein
MNSRLRGFPRGQWRANLAVLGIAIASIGLANHPSDKRKAEAAGTDSWRVAEGVTYENLTVFPVVTTSGRDTSGFATLDEALASGDALVAEEGSEILRRSRDGQVGGRPMVWQGGGAQVNQLVLVNRGSRPLILLAGEIVSGGKQDRIVGKDRVVPIGAKPLPLDVFCVEHGRWVEASPKFASGMMMVHPSVREKAAVEQSQTKVWAAVREGTTASRTMGPIALEAAPQLSEDSIAAAMASAAPTQSYRKIYQSDRVGRSVEPFAREVDRRFQAATSNLKGEQVVGVVIAYGGEVAWADAFASPQLFEKYWPKLLRSYVVEAVARPGTHEHASLRDANDFMTSLSGRTREESEPGVYRWVERTDNDYAEIELASLAPKPLTLHWLKVLRTN